MSGFLYLFFIHLFFNFSVLLIDLCDFNNLGPLSFIAFNHNNNIAKRRFLRYSRWQRVVMAKCQAKKKRKQRVFVLLYFTVTTYHRVWNLLDLCSKTPNCDPLCMSQQQEESSWVLQGNKVWVSLPFSTRLLSLGGYSILSTTMVSEWTSITKVIIYK